MKAEPNVGDEVLKRISEIWDAADKSRSPGEPLLSGLLKYAKESGEHFTPILLNTFAHLFGEWFIPHPVLIFSNALLAKRNPRSILDPCCTEYFPRRLGPTGIDPAATVSHKEWRVPKRGVLAIRPVNAIPSHRAKNHYVVRDWQAVSAA